MKKPDFERLRALLQQQETFPFDYMVKFIGKNSESFQAGIQRFEREHPAIELRSRRESSGGQHIALTYVFSARSADHIVAVLERVSAIDDVLVML